MSTASKRTKREGGEGPRSLLELFLTTPAGDHLPRGLTGDVEVQQRGPVMTCNREDTIPRVMRCLVTEGFLSAPVLDNKRYIGFIDMMDLVQKVRDLFWGDTVEAWVDFWDKEERFANCTVDDLMMTPNMWSRDPYPPIPDTCTTFFALEQLVRNNQHRAALVKQGTNKLTGILTQSMIISWLRQNKDLLGLLRNTLVSDITDQLKVSCQTVTESSKAVNAFTTMANTRVSGLAVVDDDGYLTGNISVRDLRAVGAGGEFFHRLFRSVKEFKRLARDEHPKLAPQTHYSRKTVPRKGLFVTPGETMLDVITKMYDGNIHRVYVCENADRPKPLHVISQIDVLRVVLDHMVSEASFASPA